MAKLKEELWNILQEFTDNDFKAFKWFLKEDDIVEGFPGIPVAQLEKAERQETVDLMVQKHQSNGALKLSLKILEKISRNDLVKRLENFCSRLKDVFVFCLVLDLNNHDSVLDDQRKKAKLGETKAEIKRMIRERQTKILELKRSAERSSKSADKHITDSEQVYAVLLQAVQKSLADLIKTINEQQETAQKETEGYIQELELEISELTKRSHEVEDLFRTGNSLNFHQNFASLNDIPHTKNWSKVTVSPPSYGRSVGTAVNQLEKNILKEKQLLINKAKLNRVQQFAVDVTLDPDTAHPYLLLSDDGKQVYFGDVKQNRPDNSKRFDTASNVLGKQSFSSGRFYYEVQVKGKTSWDLGVVKESIVRKGSITPSLKNGYWTIGLRNGDQYKSSGATFDFKYQPKKIGIFVDYEEGSVSFFDVDSAAIIHKFDKCSFTMKLYPFFSTGLANGGTNSNPLIITPVNYTD
ncbi:hypothetical protein L3Q82_009253 [Scortum barcoo]|uniref:Uncharacterized protein n=1 Tax=Scortum barcoo TaxID=214431 RepID=A0ACB8WGV0_9TELE|nr:hypothetical protein L3Q82_009253 [Scortum barcoo]